MILVIDNYDSFTYNLVQYIGSLGESLLVKRNDQVSLNEIEKFKPQSIIISPGPGYPDEAGISVQIIRKFYDRYPILGVCLGHQCIAAALNGEIAPAKEIVHGKSSNIYHDGSSLFKGIKNPFTAGRYHSLVVDRESLPDCLQISAETKDGQIMAIRHKEFPVQGVQFHPESILTDEGMKIMQNFLQLKNKER